MEQAIKSFLEHGESVRKLSARTLKAYEIDLNQFQAQLQLTDVGQVTPEAVAGYVTELSSNGEYRDSSIRRKVAALKIFFRYLEESGHVDRSPAAKLRIRKPVRQRKPEILEPDEIRNLLNGPKEEIVLRSTRREKSKGAENRYFCAVRDNVILELLFATGIRIGELVTLNVDSWNDEERVLQIVGRGDRTREIPITSEEVVRDLKVYLDLRKRRPADTDAMFLGRLDTRLTIYSIENIFKKYAKRAGIERHVTPHTLRHTMAALLVSSGKDVHEVKEMLGHASVLSTQVYSKLKIRKSDGAPAEVGVDHRDRIMSETPAGERIPIRRP